MKLSDFAAARNLVSLFLERADEHGGKPFLWAKRDGAWRSLSWAEVAEQVCLLAENLPALSGKGADLGGLKGADAQAIKRSAMEQGMDSLRDDGARKVLSGLTSVEEILVATQDDVEADAPPSVRNVRV